MFGRATSEVIIGPSVPGALANAARGHAHVPQHVLVPSRPHLLVDKAQVLPDILQSISDARRSVEVAEYILHPSGDGRQILEALRARALGSPGRAPVEVSVLVDRQGSAQFRGLPQRRFYDGLERDGVRLVRHEGPLNPLAGGVDHRKLFVLDGARAYVGGMGFGGATAWHDVMVRLDGPVAAQAHAEFVGRWVDSGGSVSQVQRILLEEADRAGQVPALVGARLVANTSGARLDATEATLAMARTAHDRIWVHTPYFGSPAVADILEGAAMSGVDARLSVTGHGSAFPLMPQLSRTFYRQLVGRGEPAVRVLEQQRMAHEKVVLADAWVSAGSLNLTPRALGADHELNVVSNDPQFRRQVMDMMASDEARAVRVTPADLQRPALRFASSDVGAALLRRTLGSIA